MTLNFLTHVIDLEDFERIRNERLRFNFLRFLSCKTLKVLCFKTKYKITETVEITAFPPES